MDSCIYINFIRSFGSCFKHKYFSHNKKNNFKLFLGSAWSHLYYVILIMQFYFIFPLLLPIIKQNYSSGFSFNYKLICMFCMI